MIFNFRTGISFLQVLLAAGIFLVLTWYPEMVWLSGFLTIIILFSITRQMHDVIAGFFTGRSSIYISLLAFLSSVSLVSALGGMVLLVTYVTPIMIALIFALAGLLATTLASWTSPMLEKQTTPTVFEMPVGLLSSGGVILYLSLAAYSVYLLSRTVGVNEVFNPWTLIDPRFIYVFGAATLVLGGLIFTRLRITTVLGLLCVHAFIVHSSIPLSHALLYGADGWRHLGYIQSIVHEQPLISPELSATPSIGARLGVLTYGQFWSLAALIIRLFGVNPLSLLAWLLPVLWSCTVPFLLYRFGEILGLRRRAALIFVWLSHLPFALQMAGSFSLPVNLGFILWLAAILLVLERAKYPRSGQVGVLVFFGLISIFSYSLFCLLFWFSWIVVELFLLLRHSQPMVRRIVSIKLSVFGILLIPLVELVTHYSHWPIVIHWFDQLRQLVGNFTAFYLATGPRPHDIPAGNILFNQIPLFAFVANGFLMHLWWLVPVALIFWLLVIVGWCLLNTKTSIVHQWLAVFVVACFGGYILSWYLLVGEHLFARRLDSVLALVSLVLAVFAGQWLTKSLRGITRGLVTFMFVLVATGALCASYSLGPDTDAVSVVEYQAMQQIWQTEKTTDNHCVIASTYPLLVLEALAERRIIGGGFPIDQYYNQPELKKYWVAFHSDSATPLWGKALTVTHATSCWLLIENNRSIDGAVDVGHFGAQTLWKFPR